MELGMGTGEKVVVRTKRLDETTIYELQIQNNTVLQASCNRDTKKFEYYLEPGELTEINERIATWDTWVQMRTERA